MQMPPLIDTDVHHNWKSDADVIAYLPKRWRDIVGVANGARGTLMPPTIWPPGLYGTNVRLDTFAEDGSRPGTDYATLKRQLLDPFNVRKAILSFNIGLNGGLANPQLAREVVIAANNWNHDHWLSIDDDRIASVIMVSMQEPEEAAKEIRRLAGHPKLVEVLLVTNAIGRPFGHPIYHPIYEAAAEVGLPIGIHAGGDNGGVLQTAGGLPNSRLEMHALLGQGMLHHAASFITHGVFEKYPSLHLLLIEIGISWAPWLLWSLDAMYPVLKQESAWVKRLPSEYFRQHIRMTTQPLEVSPKREQLVSLLESVEGIEEMLCFASDYPHWDTDDPTFAARLLPERWHAALFHDNAAKIYGWPKLSQDLLTPSMAPAVAQRRAVAVPS